jgi:diaminohydroxyphosphoribosylaminopyrimidine deaminase/5-amino-6-(5-phosphoribosylamino)uracil reductase
MQAITPQPLAAADAARLERALALATEAAGFAAPNPAVGCVLTTADRCVLGEGAHRYAERDHAEIVALKQAATRGEAVRGAVHGATAYVTLEPCSHTGRTGPCADALIAAGIARVVIATLDANPVVRGNGVAKLRQAGVDVCLAAGEIAESARRLNDGFAMSITQQRPFVTLKAALSVDGRLAPPTHARSERAPVWLTGSAARTDVQQLRNAHTAILTGIGTVLADDPMLTDRTGLPRNPLLRVVLDSTLQLPFTSNLVQSAQADLLVIAAEDASTEREAALRAAGADVVRVARQDGTLDLRAVVAVLHARGCISVLLEAGSALNGAFLRAGLVDRVVLYYSERELGVDALPFAKGLSSPYALELDLQRVERVAFESDITPGTQDVRVSGYLHDPWQGVR